MNKLWKKGILEILLYSANQPEKWGFHKQAVGFKLFIKTPRLTLFNSIYSCEMHMQLKELNEFRIFLLFLS